MAMATRRFFTRATSHRALAATRSASNAVVPTSPETLQLKSNLKQLENPNPRFLKYNSTNPTLTDHTSILTCPLTRVTTLPNGLRIATECNHSHTATVCVSIDTGSRFETEETNGAGYFLMNMIMRGISDEELENMGGELSSYASRDQTVYTAKVMAGDVPKVFDILSDRLQNLSFDENMIVDTRNDIMNQLLEWNEDPVSVIGDSLHAAAFRHGPLSRTFFGPRKNIMFMTKKNLQDYLATNYTSRRMVISASGAVNHDEIVEQVKKTFTKLSTNPITSTQLVEKEPAIFTGSEVWNIIDRSRFSCFVVMDIMLGSWNKATDVGKHRGSEFAQMAGIDELVEHVKAATCHYKDTGLFFVFATAKPDCLHNLASAIMQKISKLCYQVTEEDVIRAQNELKREFYKEQPKAEEIGRQLLAYGRRIPLAEMFARVDAVDVATVKRVANKFTFDKDIAIAATGPVELLPDYKWFRGRTSMRHY